MLACSAFGGQAEVDVRAGAGAEFFNLVGGHGGGDFDEVCAWDELDCGGCVRDHAELANRNVHEEDDEALGDVEAGGVGVEEEEDGGEQRDAQVSDEEDAIREPPDADEGGAHEGVEGDGGEDAAEDDGGEEALDPDAGEDKEDVVEDDVGGDEGVDDAAEDAVVAVDVLVGGGEGVGVGVEGLEGEEVLDGELGDGD